MPRRIFIALNLPSSLKKSLSSIQEEIGSLFEPFSEEKEVIRWTKPENLHVTLVFVGLAGDEDLAEISYKVKETASKQAPFSLKLDRIDYGPPGKMPPGMVWAKGEKTEELDSLQRELQKKIVGEGRKFELHITLGRIKKWHFKKIEPEERPEVKRNISLEFTVNSVDIMESQLKRGGPVYTLLESHPL